MHPLLLTYRIWLGRRKLWRVRNINMHGTHAGQLCHTNHVELHWYGHYQSVHTTWICRSLLLRLVKHQRTNDSSTVRRQHRPSTLASNSPSLRGQDVAMGTASNQSLDMSLTIHGGNLNPEKCYWYLISFKFVNGQAKLKSRKELAYLKPPYLCMRVPKYR